MACTLQLEKIRYFYAMGNSPAVNLADNLPSEENKDLLLLGCGDVRNVLFTTFSEGLHLYTTSPTAPTLDFTCCDWEPAVLARNAILFALITRPDVTDNAQQIWNAYYHIFLDAKSNSLLVGACRELHEASETMDMWHVSRFSRFLRIASSSTLSMIRQYLARYLEMATATGPEQQSNRRRIERAMRAMYASCNKRGIQLLLNTGCGGPFIGFLDESQALYKLYDDYWANGVVSGAAASAAAVAFVNPLFAFATGTQELGQDFALHYGSEPCQGFHLAEGLATLNTNTTRPFVARCCAATAMKQFERWSSAFHDAVVRDPCHVTIRLILGDAASVCRLFRNSEDATIPRFLNYWSSLELKLDGPDYAPNATTPAPRRFVAIDTSNLGDHFGMLNMLILATQLLNSSPHAIVTTETLLKPVTGAQGPSASNISGLCTDVQTLAIILGLAPRIQLNGFSAHNSVHEAALARKGGQDSVRTRERIVWTRTANVNLTANPSILIPMLQGVYMDMTLHEDWASFSSLSGSRSNSAQQRQYEIQHYTRESFAHFLKAVKQRVKSGPTWVAVMDAFFDVIKGARGGARGTLAMNSYQDLVLHLHLLDVYDIIPTYPDFVSTTPYHIDKDETVFRDWPSIPPVVCVTLLVPRSALKPIEDMPLGQIGNPVFAGNLTGAGASNDFFSAHALHGHVVRSGPIGAFDSRVTIVPAEGAWSNATSDVVLSFRVPSWILMLDPAGMTVRLVLRVTPNLGAMSLMMQFGPDFTIFKTSLDDSTRVSVTREAPYLQPPTSPAFTNIEEFSVPVPNEMTISGDDLGLMIKLSMRLQVPTEYAEEWQKKLPVSVTQVSPHVVRASSGAMSLDARFPCPVRGGKLQAKIDRSSMYCQINALAGRSSSVPWFGEAGRGVLHRVNLDFCPAVDLSNSRTRPWLTQHIAHMFSDLDADLIKDDIMADASQPARCTDGLVALKDVVRVVFVEAARILSAKGGSKGEAIAIGQEGYVVPQALRLDLGAHTIVLDALNTHAAADDQPAPTVVKTLQIEDGIATVWNAFMLACVARQGSLSDGVSMSVSASSRVAIPLLFPAPFLEPVANIPRWLQRAVDYTLAFPKAQPREEREAKVSSTSPGERACAKCQKIPAPGSVLLQCGACKAVSYCDRDCQKAHWKVHKVQCRA